MELTDDTGQISETHSVRDTEACWHSFKCAGDFAAREQLIQHYLPFARMLAAKLYGKRTYLELEFHDYFQHASIGLIEAVDRFDVSQGIKFEAYASARIKGAVLNGIETLSEKQEQVSARKRILSDRVKVLSEEQAETDNHEDLFSSLAELAIGLATGLMLEGSGMYQDDQSSLHDCTYQKTELKQLQKQIANAVQALKGNEKRIIFYHYFQHIAFEEIANILKLSKGRISQIHKAALRNLYGKLNDKLDIFL